MAVSPHASSGSAGPSPRTPNRADAAPTPTTPSGTDRLAVRFVQAVVAEVISLTAVQRSRIEAANLQQPAPVPDVDESWSDDHLADVKAQHRIDLRIRADELERDLETLPGKLDHATVVAMRVPLT